MALSEAQVSTATPAGQNMAAAPAPTPAPTMAPAATPAKPSKGKDMKVKGLPEAVVKDPAVRMTLQKSIPGVVFPPTMEEDPKAAEKLKPLEENVTKIQDELGLLFMRTKDSGAVMFNPAVISSQEVQVADDQNKLYELFPSYPELTGVSNAKPGPQGGTLTPPKAQGKPKARTATQSSTQKARLKSLRPPTPPGMSNIVGALQQRAI